jgi:hypothetical protein
MSEEETTNTRLAAIEARREARNKALDSQRDAQRAIDLEAVFELEEEYGASNIAVLEVPYTPGLPTLVAVRCASPTEVKRYRDGVKEKANGKPGDRIVAAELVASVCIVYPDRKSPEGQEMLRQILEARPILLVQLGTAATNMGAGKAEAEGKG